MILKLAQLLLFVSYLAWVNATVDFFNSGDDSHKGHIRQKKKIFARKPYRGGNYERQVASNNQLSSTVVPSVDEYSYAYSSPEESAGVSWKPITQPTVYVTSVDLENGSNRLVNNEINAPPSDKSGHVDRTQNAQGERIVFVENDSAPRYNGADSRHATAGYTLLHYYIPIEQLAAIKDKPIKEQIIEAPMKPIVIEELIKASIAPVPVFPTTSSKVSMPAQPPPTERPAITSAAATSAVTTRAVTSSTHKSQSNDLTEDEDGKYEYEYFVQDDYHGINYGHKEYRDGKYTKGDYEVVLPDGRVQHVRYFSDATGYHATVTYHPIN